jgi:hypothetical protein
MFIIELLTYLLSNTKLERMSFRYQSGKSGWVQQLAME